MSSPTPEMVIGFAREAIEVSLLVSLPMLGIGLCVGLFVSIIQAATQIQEMTLTFIPKILSIFLALLISFPWIVDKLLVFTRGVFEKIPLWIVN